jgi:hypothetical protein
MNVSNFRGCRISIAFSKVCFGNAIHETQKEPSDEICRSNPPGQGLVRLECVSLTWGPPWVEKGTAMRKLICSCAFALGLTVGLSACTDPYDPGQRAIGGGLFGAGTGAAIGGIAGGGRGAATGALIGGTLGALGGAATTPSYGYYGDGYSGYGSSGGYNRYGSYGPRYYGSDFYGSGYDGAGYYGYGR